MKKNLSWKVLVYDFNAKEIKEYDIFSHGTFQEELKKALKKTSTFDEFSEALKNQLLYYFWSKCEWELIISAWPPSDDRQEEIKIDVYSQIMLNWDVFRKYVWDTLQKN